MIKWNKFDRQSGQGQKLPEESKPVLVKCHTDDPTLPDCIVLGYLKYAAGDESCPYFVCPGVMGVNPYLWADCLPDVTVYDFYREGEQDEQTTQNITNTNR